MLCDWNCEWKVTVTTHWGETSHYYFIHEQEADEFADCQRDMDFEVEVDYLCNDYLRFDKDIQMEICDTCSSKDMCPYYGIKPCKACIEEYWLKLNL